MEYMGRLITDDHDRDPLYFDFDREFDDDGDVEGFDGMLQHIREVTSDEDEALRPPTRKVAEKFVCEMRGNRDHIPFISNKKRSDNKKKSRSYFFSSLVGQPVLEDKIVARRKRKKRIDRGIDERGEGSKRSTVGRRKGRLKRGHHIETMRLRKWDMNTKNA
ncbi:hypothetical protein OIU84_027192 [Salix udensis]|uniref:Uncharacterized protein n=1 Tax=Salix udensis TaxID=889485 RepID=A0AAD6KES2_9ROSI|nr:hypothetical protein OIU84_027192 [Salix udensis]